MLVRGKSNSHSIGSCQRINIIRVDILYLKSNIFIYVYIYTYTHIYIHIHIHTHTYTHILMDMCVSKLFENSYIKVVPRCHDHKTTLTRYIFWDAANQQQGSLLRIDHSNGTTTTICSASKMKQILKITLKMLLSTNTILASIIFIIYLNGSVKATSFEAESEISPNSDTINSSIRTKSRDIKPEEVKSINCNQVASVQNKLKLETSRGQSSTEERKYRSSFLISILIHLIRF